MCSLLLVALAWAYGTGFGSVRRWLYVPSPIGVVYGYWGFHVGYLLVISWKGLFVRDLITLGVASTIGFMALGTLLILGRLSSGKT